MTKKEYDEIQNWLSGWLDRKRKENRMYAFSSKESQVIDDVILSTKSYLSGRFAKENEDA